MCFFDDGPEDIRRLRADILTMERHYLDLRIQLRGAEEALRNDPGVQQLADKVKNLSNRLKALEEKAPWLTADIPQEVALWGQPFG
jgi:hypothetical protein